MYKLLILTFLLPMYTMVSFGQDCPKPTKESYQKVMSSAFAKDYNKCPVIITGRYLKEGFLNGMKKPFKLRKMFFFQCVEEGKKGTKQPLQTDPVGDFFVIEKDKADIIFSFSQGDKVEITGSTFTQRYMGIKLSTFFIVTDIKKVD